MHLSLFALAELIENKGRFLPQIVNGIFAICEESFWGLSAHWADEIPKNVPTPADHYIDLFAGETAADGCDTEYLFDTLVRAVDIGIVGGGDTKRGLCVVEVKFALDAFESAPYTAFKLCVEKASVEPLEHDFAVF